MPYRHTSKEILESLAEAVITIDKNFAITFINETAKKITGFHEKDIIGKYCKFFFESDFCDLGCPVINVIKNGKNIYDIETKIRGIEGEIIPIKLNVSVIKDINDDPTGAVLTFRNISVYKSNTLDCVKKNSQFGIVGKSKQIKEVFDMIEHIAPTDVPVLITGETGTGKEMVANAIYSHSLRKGKEFIKVNCSVIPVNLIESELFGHVKGAYTDAKTDRVGRFELANGGTIFLDEIGDLPLEAQPKLLRILQDGTFERIGEHKPRKTNVRVIAATNKNLQEEIKKGNFREDLYYRINLANIELPPLRERISDVPLLVDFMISKFSKVYKKEIKGIDEKSLEILKNWIYPGNVRELENIIEFAVIRTPYNDSICSCNFPKPLKKKTRCSGSEEIPIDRELKAKDLLNVLNECRWNKSEAAKKLGIDRSTLYRRMKSLGLN